MPSNIVVVEGLIAPCQMKVDHCSSGEEALRMVKAQEYDLIFMDHLMPGMDGIEATVAIRAMEGERFKTLPIVALTANAMAGMKQVFLDSGFNDYLAKPVEAQKLNAMLWKWIPEEKRESLLDKPRPSGYSL
jgi:CheY-like chemotaxis protein